MYSILMVQIKELKHLSNVSENWDAVTLSQGNIPEQDIPYLVDNLSEIAKKFGTNGVYTKEMIRTVLEYAK
jgi:hypothetical protein